MRIVITGANGFIGRHLTRRLYPVHELLCVDNLRIGQWRFRHDELTKFEVAHVDIRNPDKLRKTVQDFSPHAIVHLAAIHYIPECEKHPQLAIQTNILGTRNLIDCCPPDCRFIFASSAAVYSPSDEPHRETDRLRALDIYGETKIQGEELVRLAAKDRDLEAIVLRFFNVVGPGETNPHLLPSIVAQLRNGSRRINLGNLGSKRDYIFVGDVVEALVRSLNKTKPLSHTPLTVNIGSGECYSVREVVEELSHTVGEKLVVITDVQRVRKVDRPKLLANNELARSQLDWVPRVSFRESLNIIWQSDEMTSVS